MQYSPQQWPKFRGETPRILLLTSQYFLIGELQAACKRLGVDHEVMDLGTKEMDLDAFVSKMVYALTTFKPDFILTVNHLGVDREGVLASLLRQFKVPLASWFVDNPHLILGTYQNLHGSRNAVFTWDADTIEALEAMGFANVFHLPLAADPTRLVPHRTTPVEEWRAPISFVGNSMLIKTIKRIEASRPSQRLVESGMMVARAFGESDEQCSGRFLIRHFPELRADFEALETPDRKQAFETFLTWQSTLMYRLDCVLRLLDYSPLIVGDPGWNELLKGREGWRYHQELSYYDDLPDFYPLSDINFNCTSQQMKGAVNQRVFDVPCCGAFLLTDYRRQMEELFEPGREIIYYNQPDEIPALVEMYLNAPDKRQRIAQAARQRVLAEHTYDHRMASLMETMRQTFR
ncbi:CgeB family protein [Pseudodesulfovibrio piezophilus]|uniref:CgeB family protein n=1 Tax=Pseudodesulfovibrio piezophilus (strain DSM 21447 / JCM 15486 / C1TLV30) TaxID=1322246 RepID=M1WMN1_PSEP2|nr:glycosyltransferase [Pseudodesulfovibrio piezophilus]CCH49825.1 CgeB family protein [Pseudodesulfovibrio piezophilus C1TLV30]